MGLLVKNKSRLLFGLSTQQVRPANLVCLKRTPKLPGFLVVSFKHGCCWETFYIFACCGLVVEIQIHLTAFLFNRLLPFQQQPSEIRQDSWSQKNPQTAGLNLVVSLEINAQKRAHAFLRPTHGVLETELPRSSARPRTGPRKRPRTRRRRRKTNSSAPRLRPSTRSRPPAKVFVSFFYCFFET